MKEQEKLKSTVLKLYSDGEKVVALLHKLVHLEARSIIGSKMAFHKKCHL